MCSIGGFRAEKPISPSLAMALARGLVFYGQQRGPQAAGVWADGAMLKKAVSPEQFIGLKELDAVFQKPVLTVLTHTRMPTTGGRTDECAHPFVAGDTVVVHNGWVTNHEALKKKWEVTPVSDVDSEVLAHGIEKFGIDEFAAKHFADVQGVAALAIMHKGQLYLGRDGNPLEMRVLDIEDSAAGRVKLLVWGSTEQQVMNALRTHFLVQSDQRTTSLPDEDLIRVVGPIKSEFISRKFATNGSRYSSSYYGSGGSSNALPGWQDSARWRNGGHGSMVPHPAQQPYAQGPTNQPAVIGQVRNPKVWLDKTPVPTDDEVQQSLSASDIEMAKTASDAIVPPPHPELGVGWRQLQAGIWTYERRLAKMQLVKWGREVCTSYNGQSGGGSRRKQKDRNRNKAAGANQGAGPKNQQRSGRGATEAAAK